MIREEDFILEPAEDGVVAIASRQFLGREYRYRLLFVANGNSDTVSVINTNRDRVVHTISLSRPNERYKGSNPNSLALSPDGQTLYVN